jgi:hypothetical protein
MNPYHKHTVSNAIEFLARRYGNDWTTKWAKVSAEHLLADWCGELSAFTNRPEAITWALHSLPERCPNATQFRHLCMQAPRPEPEHKQDEEPVRGPTPLERESLRDLRDRIARGGLFARPSSDWAYALVEKAARGEEVSYAGLRMACAVVDAQRRLSGGIPETNYEKDDNHAPL